MSLVSRETLPEIRARLALARAWLASHIELSWQWLSAQGEPFTWATLRGKLTLTTPPLPKTNGGRLAVLMGVGVLLLLALRWYGQPDDKGAITYSHAGLINPILGGFGALFLIYAAIRQARTASKQAETARKQAQIAADRHTAQTNADFQRRTTETFSKAVEQLGSEKMEVQVGGIYTLERLAAEALASPATEGSGPDLYWTAMETLTAFVRERAKWQTQAATGEMAGKSDYLWEAEGGSGAAKWSPPEPATEIAAVLAVIRRRPEVGRAREEQRGWHFDLRATDLRGARLDKAHLKRADLRGTHLEYAWLSEAHLEGAILTGANLEGAGLEDARLEGAILAGTHLERADLSGAHLEGADAAGAHFEGAGLGVAHLEGACLEDATGVSLSSLFSPSGDAYTVLPRGVPRPRSWPPQDHYAWFRG
jgi:uncharacterized protein YjbI with pentapeptide repeats